MKNKILYNILFFILYSFQLSPLYYWDNNNADFRRYYSVLCRCYYYYFLCGVSACRIYGVQNIILCAPCVALINSTCAVSICTSRRCYYYHLLCAVSVSLVRSVSSIRRLLCLLHYRRAVSGPLISGI
jgi:hypothetical protein